MLATMILTLEDESDREFASLIFDQYNRLMCSEIRKVVGDSQDVQDIMQDALVSLVAKIPELRKMEQRQMVNYIITAVRNHAKNYLRRRSNLVFCSFDNEELNLSNIVPDETDIEGALVRQDESVRLSQIWSYLSDDVRELLEKKYVLQQSDYEMAETLGVKPASVRMMLTRARRSALRELRRAGLVECGKL